MATVEVVERPSEAPEHPKVDACDIDLLFEEIRTMEEEWRYHIAACSCRTQRYVAT